MSFIKLNKLECGNPIPILVITSSFLEDLESRKYFDEVEIYKNWFHILTCVHCREKIPREIKENRRELLLFYEQENLWQLPFYLMQKELLSEEYIKNYKNKHGDKTYNYFKSLLDNEDIKDIERKLSKFLFRYWKEIILNDWHASKKEKKLFPVQFKHKELVIRKSISAKAAGTYENIPPIIKVPNDIQLEGDISIKIQKQKGLISLIGGTPSVRSNIELTIYYEQGGSEILKGSDIIRIGAWKISKEKMKHIKSIHFEYIDKRN